VPINYSNLHWGLGIINVADHSIEILDSKTDLSFVAKRRPTDFVRLSAFASVNHEASGLGIHPSWERDESPQADRGPQQNNGYDCGFITVLNAWCRVRGVVNSLEPEVVDRSKVALAALAYEFTVAARATRASLADRRAASAAETERLRQAGIISRPIIFGDHGDDEDVPSPPTGPPMLGLVRTGASSGKSKPRQTKVKGRAALSSGQQPLKPGWLVTQPEAKSDGPPREVTGTAKHRSPRSLLADCNTAESPQTQPITTVLTVIGDASCKAHAGGQHAGEGGVPMGPPLKPGRTLLPEDEVDDIDNGRQHNDGLQILFEPKPEPTDSPPP
jgi:hypothetical protein